VFLWRINNWNSHYPCVKCLQLSLFTFKSSNTLYPSSPAHLSAVKHITVPITVSARSKAWTVFTRSNTGIVGSKSTQGMVACIVCVYSVFVMFYVQVEALQRADPPSKESYRPRIGLRNWKSGQAPTKGCREIIIIIIIIKTPWLLVCKRTIPTERPPLVGEVSANFCG
jgi:hypothetical protein